MLMDGSEYRDCVVPAAAAAAAAASKEHTGGRSRDDATREGNKETTGVTRSQGAETCVRRTSSSVFALDLLPSCSQLLAACSDNSRPARVPKLANETRLHYGDMSARGRPQCGGRDPRQR